MGLFWLVFRCDGDSNGFSLSLVGTFGASILFADGVQLGHQHMNKLTSIDQFMAAKYYRLAEKNGNKTLGNSW